MAIAHSNSTQVARLIEALGLERVRSLTLTAETGSVVTIVTEQFVAGSQLDRLADELETKEWVLVPRAEWAARLRWIPVVEPPPDLPS